MFLQVIKPISRSCPALSGYLPSSFSQPLMSTKDGSSIADTSKPAIDAKDEKAVKPQRTLNRVPRKQSFFHHHLIRRNYRLPASFCVMSLRCMLEALGIVSALLNLHEILMYPPCLLGACVSLPVHPLRGKESHSRLWYSECLPQAENAMRGCREPAL